MAGTIKLDGTTFLSKDDSNNFTLDVGSGGSISQGTFNGTVGTSATVPASISGLPLVKKFNGVSVSNSAVSFDNIFNSTYKDYLMFITGSTNNGGTQSYINLRLKSGGSADSGSNYRMALRGYDNSGTTRTHTGTSVTAIDISNGQDAGTADDEKTMAIQVLFHAPQLNQETMLQIHSTYFRDDTLIANYGGGAHMSSYQADSITLHSSHSSFTAVIDLYVYGLKS